jgi:ABC-type Mn2+/Zn2+ transport system ATPase subunit
MSNATGAVPFIDVHNLFAGYGKTNVLKDISLHIEKGCVAGLCGPNGAGKSTFVKVCLGMLRPSKGNLTIMGLNPWEREGRKLRFRIGYVPQNTSGGMLPVSVRDAVAMGLYGKTGFFRALPQKSRRLVDETMELCGIKNLANKRTDELSGGQRQRVAIARALAMEPALLLLDEPSSNLDAGGRVELLHIIKDRQEYDHITALIVSHDKDTLAGCAAVFRFNEGRLVETDA